MAILAIGLFLLTNLRADTELPVLWLWMVVAGIGVGPSFALFAALVQNNVEPRQVGSATASLTFFQQIGGTIGLTIAGTLLADSLTKELPGQLLKNGVPQQFVDQFQAAGAGGGSALDFTGTGDLGAQILENVPEPFRALVAPLVPNIVAGIYDAFALAIASTFWVSIGAAVLAAVLILFLPATGRAGIATRAPEEAEPSRTG
jgi:hypothetical protein